MLKKLTNLSLKVKLIGGFAMVAFITLAVGIVGYTSIANLGGTVGNLANDKLPGVESMLRVKE